MLQFCLKHVWGMQFDFCNRMFQMGKCCQFLSTHLSGCSSTLQSYVPNGGKCCQFLATHFLDAAQLLQVYVSQRGNAQFLQLYVRKGENAVILSKHVWSLEMQLDFCNRTFKKGGMLSKCFKNIWRCSSTSAIACSKRGKCCQFSFKKVWGFGSTSAIACSKSGNAANFSKQFFGMHLHFCSLMFQEGEMLPIFFKKILGRGCGSTFAIECSKRGNAANSSASLLM